METRKPNIEDLEGDLEVLSDKVKALERVMGSLAEPHAIVFRQASDPTYLLCAGKLGNARWINSQQRFRSAVWEVFDILLREYGLNYDSERDEIMVRAWGKGYRYHIPLLNTDWSPHRRVPHLLSHILPVVLHYASIILPDYLSSKAAVEKILEDERKDTVKPEVVSSLSAPDQASVSISATKPVSIPAPEDEITRNMRAMIATLYPPLSQPRDKEGEPALAVSTSLIERILDEHFRAQRNKFQKGLSIQVDSDARTWRVMVNGKMHEEGTWDEVLDMENPKFRMARRAERMWRDEDT